MKNTDRRSNLGIFVISLGFILILVLASCAQAEPTATPAPTTTPNVQTSVARIPATATPTIIPSYTPRLDQPTITPKPTGTPTPTPEYLPGTENSLFPIPQRPYYTVNVSPPPIETPIYNTTYQLREWAAADALAQIQEIDRYAYKAGVALGGSGDYYNALLPIINLSITDALYRFPEAEYVDALLWKQAVIQFQTRQKDYSIYFWLHEQIEKQINSSLLENIELFLKAQGFNTMIVTVDNFKGDGEAAHLLLISPSYGIARKNLLFLVTGTEGNYKLSFILDNWRNINTYEIDTYHTPQDQDEDGIPEIVIITNEYPCRLRILEWQTDHLVDLSNGNIFCSPSDQTYRYYEFNPENYPDINLITSQQSGSKLLWVLKGNIYQLVLIQNPIEYFLDALDKANYSNYPKNLERIQGILDEWENLDFSNTILYLYNFTELDKDIWRLNLGFTYLFIDQAKGLEIIQEVADSPYNPEDPIPAAIAATFLDNFSGERTQLIPACQAVSRVHEEMASINPDGNYFSQANSYRYLLYFCKSGIVMDYLLGAYSAEEFPELLAYLSQFPEISYRNFIFNEKSVYLILHKLRPFDIAFTFVYQNENSLESIHPEYFNFIDLNTLTIKSLPLPGADEFAYIFSDEETVNLYEFDFQSDSPSINLLIEFWEPVILETTIINGNLYVHELEAMESTQENECERYNEVYFDDYWWDQENHQFIEIDFLTFLLFEVQDYEQTINLIQQYLRYIKPLYIRSIQRENDCTNGQGINFDDTELAYPRLLYLLGLAYELNGQAQLAVQTYYTLWLEAPDSGYALLARAKLVEVN